MFAHHLRYVNAEIHFRYVNVKISYHQLLQGNLPVESLLQPLPLLCQKMQSINTHALSKFSFLTSECFCVTEIHCYCCIIKFTCVWNVRYVVFTLKITMPTSVTYLTPPLPRSHYRRPCSHRHRKSQPPVQTWLLCRWSSKRPTTHGL